MGKASGIWPERACNPRPEKKGTKIANTRVSHRRNERENAARRAKITILGDTEVVEKPVEKPWKRRGNAWGQLSAERA